MFGSKNNETVIAAGLRIEGKVAADGLVKVHGEILGDLLCTSLVISDNAAITGTVTADTVVVDGTVEGPIRGKDVILLSHACVKGDIHYTSLAIEKGARFDGRSRLENTSAPAKTSSVAKIKTADRKPAAAPAVKQAAE